MNHGFSFSGTNEAIDVQSLHVCRVYAEAAWRAAENLGQTAEFVDEYLTVMKALHEKCPEVTQFFGNLALGAATRERLLEQAFRGRVSDLLYSFLRTLNAHDRLGLALGIGWVLRERLEASRGRVPVLVRSGYAMADAEVEAVRQALAETFRIEPVVQTEVDPNLLGGLWVRIGDTVYDRTVRSNLARLKDNLVARRTHEVSSR